MKKFISLLLLSSGLAYAAPIKISHQVITFSPKRSVEVGRAFLGVRCLREASIWEDSKKEEEKTFACTDFKINGKAMTKYQWEKPLEMKKIGPNQFEMDPVEISYSATQKGHVCLRVIATLENGTYENPLDEWSLLGFCTVPVLPFQVDSAIYNNHRVMTLNEFKNLLLRPIDLMTKSY